MKLSSLEITGQEYLIRLNKEEFDLSFIYQLLKRIQDETVFFNRSRLELANDEDIISRNVHVDAETFQRFDRLDEK